MKFSVWQEVEVEMDLGSQELQSFIAEHWNSMDEDGFPVRNKVISVVTLLKDLSDEQLKSFSSKAISKKIFSASCCSASVAENSALSACCSSTFT